MLRLLPSRGLQVVCSRLFSAKSPAQNIVKEIDPVTGEVKKKKTNIIPKITLLSGDNSMSVVTLPEAEKLAKRRDLKLVKIIDFDVKTQRSVYRLMTGAEYHQEDLKQREQKKVDKQNSVKGEKLLFINNKIAQHDLETQLKKASQWIKKKYEVRVIINGSTGNVETSENLFSAIEQYFQKENSGVKLVQKRQKGNDIKFQILPPKVEQDK